MKKYDVILADPPWPYQFPGTRKANNSDYKTMTISDICSLSINNLASDNSVLFIWGIWNELPGCFEVVESWGFTYKTEAWIWVKSKSSGFGFHFGMGYYTRANTEVCLLATKGKMPPARHDIQALIYSPVRQHSRKPDDQYRKIEALYPDMKYLELFARKKREGWDAWGNEINSDVEIEK